MPPLALCSWSLTPASPEELASTVRTTGLSRVQLALGPLVDSVGHDPKQGSHAWRVAHTRRVLEDAGITIVSGMMATMGEDYSSLSSIRATGGVLPDRHWATNLARARQHALLASELGLSLVSFHAGFVPEETGRERDAIIARVRTLARLFACFDITLALETGQEHVHTLLDFLREVGEPTLRINFDPANMLLYGMGEPVEALRTLVASHASLIAQVHLKDALPTGTPGTWGQEVAIAPSRTATSDGRASVAWPALLGVLRDAGLLHRIDLVLEREAGTSRAQDIARGAHVITRCIDTCAPGALHTRPVGVGVLGMGFMGRTHALASMRCARLVGACDPSIDHIASSLREQPAGNLPLDASQRLSLEGVRLSTQPARLLEDPDVELVVIATPTDTHVPLAQEALRAGKHVLVEKPVALALPDVLRLRDAAHGALGLCVPAMVMRWWPGWPTMAGLLRASCLEARQGDEHPLLSLERVGSPPAWSSFYTDPARSGGALTDLHIHDVDFVNWSLGVPEGVLSTGTIDDVSSTFFSQGSRDTPTLEARASRARGAWQAGSPFRIVARASGMVHAEPFSMSFDLDRGALFEYAGNARLLSVPQGVSAYDLQLADVGDAIRRGRSVRSSLDHAVASACVLDAERRSLTSGSREPVARA